MQGVLNVYTQYYGNEEVAREKLNTDLARIQTQAGIQNLSSEEQSQFNTAEKLFKAGFNGDELECEERFYAIIHQIQKEGGLTDELRSELETIIKNGAQQDYKNANPSEAAKKVVDNLIENVLLKNNNLLFIDENNQAVVIYYSNKGTILDRIESEASNTINWLGNGNGNTHNLEKLGFIEEAVQDFEKTFNVSSEELLEVDNAEGRILSSINVSCPPAVPIVISGEQIDENAISVMKYDGVEKCFVVKEK
jgi:hypothetical protein